MKMPQLGVSPRQGALALAAGLLGAAAFWPLSLWPLMLVSIALLFRLLRDLDVRTARNVGLVYGLAFAGGTMYWMFLIFGALAVPLLAIMAAYFGLLATLFAMTRGLSVAARVCLAAVFAVGVEWLRGDAWYLRFPWYPPARPGRGATDGGGRPLAWRLRSLLRGLADCRGRRFPAVGLRRLPAPAGLLGAVAVRWRGGSTCSPVTDGKWEH
jgi:Apolipoprotein N-acyltransferase N-terminal domain